MNKLEIGCKYIETRDLLREEIRAGTLEGLELLAVNHACYCCVRRIEGVMYVVERKGENSVECYFFDTKCYEDAKVFEYREGMVVQ